MRNDLIKCHECGKFIKALDIYSGDVKAILIYSGNRLEIHDVMYICLVCLKKLNKDKIRTQK